MWWRIAALTLIGILVIFGLGFLIVSSVYLHNIRQQNSDLTLIKSDLLQLQSQMSEMNSTLNVLQSQMSERPNSLQVVRQNMTWLAHSATDLSRRMANPLQAAFQVEGFSTMTVLLKVENVSSVGPVDVGYQDVEITLGTALWWTTLTQPTLGLPSQGSGGFTEELNMQSHCDDVVRVYHDYVQTPEGTRTYFLDWQIMPVSISTIETKAPYVSLLFFANSTAPVDGWAMVDVYAYLRN